MAGTYLDYAATTPVDPRVADLVLRLMVEEFGNSGSRTHVYGAEAAKVVERAREQVAHVVEIESSGVVFTSGATEANNLALLGLADEGRANGRMHVVSTSIEHKAVLEPLEVLAKRGFDVELVDPDAEGAVDADDVASRVREDTLLVSVMHVNNETGVRQPIAEIADRLEDPGVYFHVDAAQGFGKELDSLRHERVDLMSTSGHKLFAPKGIGALLLRRRQRRKPPVSPLMFGGGQERGIRPGTQAVPLIAGFGLAAELAVREHQQRVSGMIANHEAFVAALSEVGAVFNGHHGVRVPFILNAGLPGVDSEAAILALRDLAAVSNGSACTSSSYEPSHVLRAMNVDPELARCALRFSWGAEPVGDLAEQIAARLAALL